MSDGSVTTADVVRWLHQEGLSRLAAVGANRPEPVAAYTIDVSSGMVTVHPAATGGKGSDTSSIAADDLPHPGGSTGRLVIVGITTAESILVVNLAASLMISIDGDFPEGAARAWVSQLLLNPDVTLTTNCTDVAVEATPRCKQAFIPGGGGSIISVDDGTPPVTTITLNAAADGPDRLDIAVDGMGEMYLGTKFWQVRHVMKISDGAWSALTGTLAGESAAPTADIGPGAGATAPATDRPPLISSRPTVENIR
ncbi:hypothetical protein [Nocardia cyriacigeorgica]|uniref:hypothetical protein n=1 Tax=Nocardia cyriacigeorgica TaxID=135487 RepID=UPI00030E3866|nr:hypothetical protein [Nocardia cyriacigeorgica]TLF55284.1 hypothetical protein FEK31_21050 [Nocardia cyriacigeorgica]